MKIRITNGRAGTWYVNRIGECFDVTDPTPKHYVGVRIDRIARYIDREDLEIIEGPCAEPDTTAHPKIDPDCVKRDPYTEAAQRIAELVKEKQAAYGDSFGKAGEVLKILYPCGIPVEAYTDALAIIRVIDKLFRIATDRDALGESPWSDIMGYALLSEVKRHD